MVDDLTGSDGADTMRSTGRAQRSGRHRKGLVKMRQLRVLSVIHEFRPTFSGEGEWWLRMVPVLRARGVDVEILTSSPSAASGRRELIEGVPVQRVATGPGPGAYWRKLGKILGAIARRRPEFDIVLFHGPNHDAVYAASLIGGLLGWKVLYKMTLIGSDDLATVRNTGRFARLRLGSLHMASGLVGMSRVMIRGFEGSRLVRDQLLIAPQGVDTARFRPPDPSQKRVVRMELGIPEDAKVVLFCGALVYRKGVDVLAEAWWHVAAQVDDALLLLVGPDHRDGRERVEHELLRRAGLEPG
jgi:teichuronic acid biosynthesis glycosyltransferase TuaC